MRTAASNNTECIKSWPRAASASQTPIPRPSSTYPRELRAGGKQQPQKQPKHTNSKKASALESALSCSSRAPLLNGPGPLSSSIALDQHEKQRVWRGAGVAVPRTAAQGAAWEPDRVRAQERAAAAARGAGRCMVPTAVAWKGHRCALGAAPLICTPDGECLAASRTSGPLLTCTVRWWSTSIMQGSHHASATHTACIWGLLLCRSWKAAPAGCPCNATRLPAGLWLQCNLNTATAGAPKPIQPAPGQAGPPNATAAAEQHGARQL